LSRRREGSPRLRIRGLIVSFIARPAKWQQSQRGLCRRLWARPISTAPLSSGLGLSQTDVLLRSWSTGGVAAKDAPPRRPERRASFPITLVNEGETPFTINRDARVTEIFWTTAATNGEPSVRVQRMKGVTGDIGHSVEAPNLATWSYGRLHSREHADNLKPRESRGAFFIPSFPEPLLLRLQPIRRAAKADAAGLGDTDDTKREIGTKQKAFIRSNRWWVQRQEIRRMGDNFKNGGAPDRSRVSMDDQHEARYWAETIGCSKDELAVAVARVGNSSDAVRRELFRAWAYGTIRRDAPEPRGRGRRRKRAWLLVSAPALSERCHRRLALRNA